MLLRISLIVAIIAGLAVGALNFTKVKEKITVMDTSLHTMTNLYTTTLGERNTARKELKQTADKLKQTEATLAATTEERDTALKNLDSKTKLAEKVTGERDKALKELDDARGELAAYSGTGLKPEEIMAIKKNYRGLEENMAAAPAENGILAKRITKLDNELAVYKNEEHHVLLPAGLKGKVLIVDPKWNFVVLNIGEDQRVLDYSEFLVNRNGKLVAKIRVRSVQKDRSVANIMPGWQLGEVLEGDSVIPAYPASS